MASIFYKTTSPEPVAEYIAGKIRERLASGKRVLWLVPGGSAIAVAVLASRKLAGAPLANLAVTLTDERYGPVGHADSNMVQLEAAGFSLPRARMLPVLAGEDLSSTTDAFDKLLHEEIDAADYVIGLFGIGADGHTAGMLPHTAAVASARYAEGYASEKFTRVTMTARAIALVDEAVVYALGEAKWPVIEALERSVALARQPAQALKQTTTLAIFNDLKGVEYRA
jgi:6-phosphogluconolactonase/glucosamine-6-phosphate isomerase/deaminase